jgi:hypothetical protein
MALSFFLESEQAAPPQHSGTRIYVDGTSHSIREGLDIELSHWNPNTTQERFKADSSTEIALNFISFGELPTGGLVINNHMDVDGVLAAWSLLNPREATARRELLVAAAETGDFWAWGPEPALAFYQALTEIIKAGEAGGRPPELIHQDCFAAIPGLLEKGARAARLDALHAGLKLIEQGALPRQLHHHRFVAWQIPRAVHQGELDRALMVNAFNASLDDGSLLHAVLRNRLDARRVQLVSVEGEGGWYHDLHYPGYMWALTVNRWRAPGFWEGETGNTWYFRYAPLEAALARLAAREKGPGRWQSAEELTPFTSVLGRAFPVVALCMGEDDLPAPSSLSPEQVTLELRQAFTYDLTGARL